MIFSDKCFICQEKLIPVSYMKNLNPAGIFNCQKGCSSYQIRNGINYFFNFYIHIHDVVVKRTPHGFSFHTIKDGPNEFMKDPLMVIAEKDISIDNTYDLSEYFYELAAKMDKVKTFL